MTGMSSAGVPPAVWRASRPPFGPAGGRRYPGNVIQSVPENGWQPAGSFFSEPVRTSARTSWPLCSTPSDQRAADVSGAAGDKNAMGCAFIGGRSPPSYPGEGPATGRVGTAAIDCPAKQRFAIALRKVSSCARPDSRGRLSPRSLWHLRQHRGKCATVSGTLSRSAASGIPGLRSFLGP
jgi:hypothetical protein